MNRTTSKSKGFTLVELLVVIAIIGVLASLLLPALSAARVRGYEADCHGNLRQIGAALYQYATTYSDFFPKADGYDGNTSYFAQQNNLLTATEEYIPTNSSVWFCKRYVREAARQEGLTKKELIAERMGKGWIGYFYWAWMVQGSTPYEIDTTATNCIWFTQGWKLDTSGIVLASDRFRDKGAWAYPEDWQFHGGTSVEVPLTEPGSIVLVSGGSTMKVAPRQ